MVQDDRRETLENDELSRPSCRYEPSTAAEVTACKKAMIRGHEPEIDDCHAASRERVRPSAHHQTVRERSGIKMQ